MSCPWRKTERSCSFPGRAGLSTLKCWPLPTLDVGDEGTEEETCTFQIRPGWVALSCHQGHCSLCCHLKEGSLAWNSKLRIGPKSREGGRKHLGYGPSHCQCSEVSGVRFAIILGRLDLKTDQEHPLRETPLSGCYRTLFPSRGVLPFLKKILLPFNLSQVCVERGGHVPWFMWRSEDNLAKVSSVPSITWGPGIKLRSLGWAAGVFTHWAIWLVLPKDSKQWQLK